VSSGLYKVQDQRPGVISHSKCSVCLIHQSVCLHKANIIKLCIGKQLEPIYIQVLGSFEDIDDDNCARVYTSEPCVNKATEIKSTIPRNNQTQNMQASRKLSM